MTRREQELLEKQLWGVSSRSPQNGMIILMIIAVFLVAWALAILCLKQSKPIHITQLSLIIQTGMNNRSNAQ